jgi:hypothetical protein
VKALLKFMCEVEEEEKEECGCVPKGWLVWPFYKNCEAEALR